MLTPEQKKENAKTQFIAEHLFCFSTVQRFLINKPEVMAKFNEGGSHTSHSAKIVTSLFGHCKEKEKEMSMSERLKGLKDGGQGAKFMDSLLGEVDLDAIFEDPNTKLNQQENLLLKQFNTIAVEMQKRQKQPKTPEVNVAGINVSEMSWVTLVVPVVLIGGFLVLAWKMLFVKEEKKKKKKKKRKNK